MRVLESHVWPVGHAPGQRPPHPSAVPHATPAGQFGTHRHVPFVQRSIGLVHTPVGQRPPHPLGAPHMPVAGQLGTHGQRPMVHAPPPGHTPVLHVPPQPSEPPHMPVGGQLGTHAHVSMQVPFEHTKPVGQVTPSHKLRMQRPPAQNIPASQTTSAQGSGATHVTLQP